MLTKETLLIPVIVKVQILVRKGKFQRIQTKEGEGKRRGRGGQGGRKIRKKKRKEKGKEKKKNKEGEEGGGE